MVDVGGKIVSGIKGISAGSIGLNRMPLHENKQRPNRLSTSGQKNKENL